MSKDDFIAESAEVIKARMQKVHHLADHYAYTCECGCVHFHILKSGN